MVKSLVPKRRSELVGFVNQSSTPSKNCDPKVENCNVKDDALELATLTPSDAENVKLKEPACAVSVEGVTLKYLFDVSVFALIALYVPPEVELEVTVAVLPRDPLVT